MASRYRGLPSKACASCRERRIKCDRQRPSCSQCLRSGTECSGYRDQAALTILDQTQTTASKFKTRSQMRSVRASRPSTTATPSSSRETGGSGKLSSSLSVPLEDQGVAFFWRNYVTAGSETVYTYLPEFYLAEPARSLLPTTVTAVGLAALSSSLKNPKILMTAKKYYNLALSYVRDALESTAARRDQTLLSVLLFCVFEALVCSSSQAISSWLKHAGGAAALGKLRGTTQFETELGCRLFLHLRMHTVISCMQTGESVPVEIVSLTSRCRNVRDDQLRVLFDLFSIMDDVCQLRADEIVATEDDDDVIGSRAILIADRLEEWYIKLPQDYVPTRIQLAKPSSEVLSDHYLVFTNLFVSSVHSLFRVCSLLTYEIILIHISPHLPHFNMTWPPPSYSPLTASQTALFHSAASSLLRIIDAICASAPYHLGFSPQPESKEPNPTTSSSSRSKEEPRNSPSTVQGNPILWPLYMAGKMQVCPPETRAWIIGRLRKLGDEIGIAQALLFARFLDEGIFVQVRWMKELLAGTTERHVEV